MLHMTINNSKAMNIIKIQYLLIKIVIRHYFKLENRLQAHLSHSPQL